MRSAGEGGRQGGLEKVRWAYLPLTRTHRFVRIDLSRRCACRVCGLAGFDDAHLSTTFGAGAVSVFPGSLGL